MKAPHYHNTYSDETHTGKSEVVETVKILDASQLPGLVYLLPTPKSPHGVDVDPTGEYIIGNGKLFF